MADDPKNGFDASGIITRTISPRTEDYYLVTKVELQNISQSRILSDIFVVLFSIVLGAFLSTVIAQPTVSSTAFEALATLQIYRVVFGALSAVFFVLALVLWVKTQLAIRSVTRTRLADPL